MVPPVIKSTGKCFCMFCLLTFWLRHFYRITENGKKFCISYLLTLWLKYYYRIIADTFYNLYVLTVNVKLYPFIF